MNLKFTRYRCQISVAPMLLPTGMVRAGRLLLLDRGLFFHPQHRALVKIRANAVVFIPRIVFELPTIRTVPDLVGHFVLNVTNRSIDSGHGNTYLLGKRNARGEPAAGAGAVTGGAAYTGAATGGA